MAISDVHNQYDNLVIPPCDILISAGDFSFQGQPTEVKDFHEWLNEQEANHIISVQGNHEKWVEANFQLAKEMAVRACPAVYFMDEGIVEIEGLKIFCSAVTPWFNDWAWNKWPAELAKHWQRIPDDIDILVTHGPAYGIHDLIVQGYDKGKKVGCPYLLERIKEIKVPIHICGHIHAHGGKSAKVYDTTFYNASICDENYNPSNPITIIDL